MKKERMADGLLKGLKQAVQMEKLKMKNTSSSEL